MELGGRSKRGRKHIEANQKATIIKTEENEDSLANIILIPFWW